MKLHIAFFFLSFVILSCTKKPSNFSRVLTDYEKLDIVKIDTLTPKEGYLRLKTHCYSCHNPNSNSHDNMLAPPLAGIKYKYKQLYPNATMFIAQMSDFVHQPTKENAVMKGPVRKFGLMPKTTLNKKQIQELVQYIYDTPLETPNWFPKHFEEQHNEAWKGKR